MFQTGGKFLSSGLYRKIRLSLGNNFFGRISVLHNEITGITGHGYIIYFSLRTTPESNRFADISKMVRNGYAATFTGLFCFFNYKCKITPLHIF